MSACVNFTPLKDASGKVIGVVEVIREHHHGVEVVMLTGHGSIDTAIESIRATLPRDR